ASHQPNRPHLFLTLMHLAPMARGPCLLPSFPVCTIIHCNTRARIHRRHLYFFRSLFSDAVRDMTCIASSTPLPRTRKRRWAR
uniref:Secreted protein n=1 Tax=Aegilops tauschii subsp. strangulata TaxID=200361 RepID=A0A453MX68_AEGTS